jgi:hypothetical protein
MSDALSITPSPRLGRNGSSDGSAREAIAAARARSSRSASSSASSSGLDSRTSRCCALTAPSSRAFTPGSASATDWPAGRSSSAASLTSSR